MYDVKYIERLRSLSEILRATTIKKLLLKRNFSSITPRIIKHKSILRLNQNSFTFEEVIKEIYALLLENYRNEYVYKNSILNKIILAKYNLHSTTLLNEFKIGKSIADLIFINGEVKLFEVKTDLDNLYRLESQLADYKKFCEKIYIVTNSKYADKLLEFYEHTSIGLIEFTDDNLLVTKKEAQEDKSKFDHETIFKTLRKQDYLNIINEYFGEIPSVPNTMIFRECFNLSLKIDMEEFQKLAIEQIKFRKISNPEFIENNEIPSEIKFACHSLNLNLGQYKSFQSLLTARI